MMKNVTIRYSNSMTVNLGNFQNLRPEYEMTATLSDDEHPDAAFAKIKAKVDALLEADVADIETERDA